MTVQVRQLLQRMIQPNDSVRLSPYVESALRSVSLDPDLDDSQRGSILRESPIEIAQTQLGLLDAISTDRLQGEVRVAIAGTGRSSRLVALLDLLLVWSNACRLESVEFPITDLLPVSAGSTSQPHQNDSLISGYVSALRERLASSGDEELERVLQWTETLARSAPRHPEADLVIVDAGDEDANAPALESLAPGGMLLVLASGTETGAKWLARWRRQTLQVDQSLRALGPCGQEFGNRMPESCEGCWPVRSERVEMPTLELSDDPVQAENPARYRLLGERGYTRISWSYTLIGRNRDDGVTSEQSDDQNGLRFVGTFQQSNPVPARPAGRQSDDPPIYLKVCPASNQGRPTVVATRSSKLSRELQFGDRFDVSPVNTVERGGGIIISPADEQIGPGAPGTAREVSEFFPSLNSEDAQAGFHRGLDELAYRLFGFPGLRTFQHIILERVLTGRSVLGIAATGGGKSECFILPSMILPGITVVVSPLKSLMMDQYQERVDRRYGLGRRATWINGDLTRDEQRHRLDRMIRGDYSLIYLTPEQLDKDTTITALSQADRRIGIRYLAIDEAHCISQWGHDFRPAYLSTLRRLSDAGIDPVRIALTATASPQVRADICKELGLTNEPMAENGDVYIYSSNRPELNLITRVVGTGSEKVQRIAKELEPFAGEVDGSTGSALVFMPWTQDKNAIPKDPAQVTPHVTSIASYLERALQTRVAIYHGKMDPEGQRDPDSKLQMNDRDRQLEQDSFIHGESRIMVATKGFGMGIDKPDIRMVIHATPPGNLEAYVQEAGRAGRDGEPSNVVLYYSPQHANDDHRISDFGIQRSFLETKRMDRIDVQGIARFLMIRYRNGQTAIDIDAEDLQDYIEKYRLDRDELPKSFRPRREEATESPNHTMILDRGHLYNEWSVYLDRVLRELLTFTTLMSQSDRGSFFESVSSRNRAREQSYRDLTLKQRRDIFGASRRAFGNIAQQRARQAGRDRPTSDDDWFGIPDLAWPRGWNVRLGSVFGDAQELVDFVNAFCDAHEQRYENARDSYARLLTDYLGLNPNGTRNPKATPQCLRSVMLGYLKTNEIVQDGNCLSCSNCVPDEKFDQYTLEQRRAVVIRIPEHIQTVLDALEASAESVPDPDQVAILIDAIRRNSEEARGLERYVAGWSGRILDEQPEHVGIRWLRVELFDSEDEIELHEEEFVGHLRSLLHHIQTNHLQRLWELFARVRDMAGLSRNRDVVRFHAELAERLGDPREETQALARFRSLSDDVTIGADTSTWLYGRMRALHHENGELPDSDRYEDAVLNLARISPEVEVASAYYLELRPTWFWNEIDPELRILQLHRTVRVNPIWALLRLWLDNRQVNDAERFGLLIDYLASAPPEVIDRAAQADLHRLIDEIEDLPAAAPALASRIAARLIQGSPEFERFDQRTARLLERLFSSERELVPDLARAFLSRAVDPEISLELYRQIEAMLPDDPETRLQLMELLAGELSDLDERDLKAWLSLVSVDVHEQSAVLSRRVVAAISSLPQPGELLDDLRVVASTALWGSGRPRSLHRHWISIMRRHPGLLGEYIQDALEAEPPEIEFAELAFSQMLDQASPRDLTSFLIWAQGSEVIRSSPAIFNASELYRLMTQWVADQPDKRRVRAGETAVLRLEFEQWCTENHLENALQMDSTHYTTIVDKCLPFVGQTSRS